MNNDPVHLEMDLKSNLLGYTGRRDQHERREKESIFLLLLKIMPLAAKKGGRFFIHALSKAAALLPSLQAQYQMEQVVSAVRRKPPGVTGSKAD